MWTLIYVCGLQKYLQDIAADMTSMPSIQSYIKDINDYRTTRKNINITFATLERRLKLDPWLPLVTTVSPSSVSVTRALNRQPQLAGLHAYTARSARLRSPTGFRLAAKDQDVLTRLQDS